ncbi:MAG: aminodeoxychorismate synthase component I [Proteobacteria bacterium]|nr:aminodeoxychorismate synthase component I [Pseudomonadota bacterium]
MLRFDNPVEVIQVTTPNEVPDRLRYLETVVERDKLHAAGFITYEAAPAFDEALSVCPSGELPLVCFGLYKEAEVIEPPRVVEKAYSMGEWIPSVSHEDYHRSITEIKDYIKIGDTYQVNFTLRLHSRFSGDPLSYFFDLIEGQRSEYAAFVDLGSCAICSASPELFFDLENNVLTSKPMKGTFPRGRTLEEDVELRRQLASSEKNRAENIMIVDMVRNDMGRIAETGSVNVASLFDVETYPYVLQMTSTVESRVARPFSEVVKALFPCASITGAPKVRTMEIIRELESTPRGIYTGAIGFLSPGGRAQFNVAIRTVTINRMSGLAEYGVGGGIVWDSDAEEEYRECLTKAAILHGGRKPFKLFESLLWDPEDGYFLLGEHLDRLSGSARYFGFELDLNEIVEALEKTGKSLPGMGAKVRLLVDDKGKIVLETDSLTGVKSTNLKVGIARAAVDSSDPFLYHKTTRRDVFENARKEFPECDDVLLWNEKGEITESCRANVVVALEGELVTPRLECGLLAGTYRRHLLETNRIKEGIVTVDDLKRAEKVFLINSVRRWMDGILDF